MRVVKQDGGHNLQRCAVNAQKHSCCPIGQPFSYIPSRHFSKPPRPTQPGHSFVGRRNEYYCICCLCSFTGAFSCVSEITFICYNWTTL